MPDIFDAMGNLNDAYVWAMVVAPPEQVLEDWDHNCTVNHWRQFGPKSRPSGLLRWIPTRVQDRITADETGWTSFEDFAAAMHMKVQPPK